MRHVVEMEAFIKTLVMSSRIHALVVQSPAGWAKSSTITEVLGRMGVKFESIGSVSTPLFLYNSIVRHPHSILVLDDVAGLLGDAAGMAILKAATWPSSGTEGKRIVTWGSTGDRALQSSIEFTGKLILLTNSIQGQKAADSFLSRALYFSIQLSPEEVREVLTSAAKDARFFDNLQLSSQVAEFLTRDLSLRDASKVSLRTLQIGYELARANPEGWTRLLDRLIPVESPEKLVANLSDYSPKVGEQIREFTRRTGLSRRTFYNYRKKQEGSSGGDSP